MIKNHFLFSATIILTLCLALPSHAQRPGLPYNRFTGEITQTKVVQTGQTKEKAYYAVKAWLAKTYPNFREMIKIEDLNAGRIVFQHNERISAVNFKSFSYRVTVDVKDGNYSCTINGVKTLSPGSAVYTSADMDFSNMGMYGQDIDDIDREISITKDKKELEKLYSERGTLKSFLRDYDKSHNTMNLHFDYVQNALRNAISSSGSLAAK